MHYQPFLPKTCQFAAMSWETSWEGVSRPEQLCWKLNEDKLQSLMLLITIGICTNFREIFTGIFNTKFGQLSPFSAS